MSNLVTVDMYKTSTGKLKYVNSRDEVLIKERIGSISMNQKVKVQFDFTPGDERSILMNKIHAMIGEISKETGDEFDSIKDEIKRRAGLFDNEEDLRSLKDCSAEDLKAAINSAVNLGEFLGMSIK